MPNMYAKSSLWLNKISLISLLSVHEKISLKVCTISSKQPQVGTPSPLQGNWENSSEKGPTVKWGTPA